MGRCVAAVALAAALAGTASPVHAAAREPDGIDRFLNALGSVESGGRYDARNATTGAYGKYQILPSNWPAWARRYLGDPNARPTPQNQEIVARGRVIDLYDSLRDWAAVAHWWLTGRTLPPGQWSAAALRYVEQIMELFGAGSVEAARAISPAGRGTDATGVTFQEASVAIDFGGRWALARHPGYSHGRVRYADEAGTTATFTFVGRAVAWYGPVGPTRGRARVYLDGHAVRIVTLRRPTFRASLAVFRYAWQEAGPHTLRIEVLDAPGRGTVAIDRFIVTR